MPDEIVTITDENAWQFINPVIDGEKKSHGLRPRDYSVHPSGYLRAVPTYPASLLIPQDRQQAMLDDQIARKSSLWDFREANYDILKSLDQNGYGLCWAFSTTKAQMYERMLQGEPGLRLSGWYTAGIVKGWRDEGGWGAESCQSAASAGPATLDEVPSYKSSYATDAVRASAQKRRILTWFDGTDSRETNTQIMISAFLLGKAPVIDLNWMSHSMCGCRLVSINPLIVDCDNSWGESAGTRGIYRLTGSKAVPDGICVPFSVMPSAA